MKLWAWLYLVGFCCLVSVEVFMCLCFVVELLVGDVSVLQLSYLLCAGACDWSVCVGVFDR